MLKAAFHKNPRVSLDPVFSVFHHMKLLLLFALLCSILAFPFERRDISALLRPVEQGIQLIAKPAINRATAIVRPMSRAIPVLGEMHFIGETGAKVNLATTPKFIERHISFTGTRAKASGRFPPRNTLIKDPAVQWEQPAEILNRDKEPTGRVEFISKNPVSVEEYSHAGNGVYNKVDSAMKKLVAHGTLVDDQYVIDHFHGTLNAKS